MNKFKILVIGLALTGCATLASFVPAKAEARHRGDRNGVVDADFDRGDRTDRVGRVDRHRNFDRNFVRNVDITPIVVYPNNYNRTPYVNTYNPNIYFNRNIYTPDYYSTVRYPQTVYLIDSSNSANQLNIINATRNGGMTAAYIIVTPDVYNRLVNDYNISGIVTVSVDTSNNLVTFYTSSETFSTVAVSVTR
jgi:hypothetical protein